MNQKEQLCKSLEILGRILETLEVELDDTHKANLMAKHNVLDAANYLKSLPGKPPEGFEKRMDVINEWITLTRYGDEEMFGGKHIVPLDMIRDAIHVDSGFRQFFLGDTTYSDRVQAILEIAGNDDISDAIDELWKLRAEVSCLSG